MAGDAFVTEAGLPAPDAEGTECAVIDGLSGALDDCRAVCHEVHRDRVEPSVVAGRLRDHGFTVEPVTAPRDAEVFLGGLADRHDDSNGG